MSGTKAGVLWKADALEALAESGALVKTDRPRWIDRYIDYFGDTAAGSSARESAAEPARASAGGGHRA